jgi:hypothetical protein
MLLLQIPNDNFSVIHNSQEIQVASFALIFRFLINFFSVGVLIKYIYYPIYKHRELFFTFFTFNCIIFFISFLLNQIDLSMGAAFGLFAVFSMLRYKTEEIAIKDMTYLFLSIAIGLISAVAKIKGIPDHFEWLFLIAINGTILLITFLLESNIFGEREFVKLISYENLELIKDGKQDVLVADLKFRTGFDVHRYTIQHIDFLKNTVRIKIYYRPKA